MNFPCAFLDGIGGSEMMIIMLIVLLLFGGNKMPELAKGLGKSIREFKKAASGVEEEVRRAIEEHEEPQPKKFPTHPPGATSQLPGAVQQTAPASTQPPPATPPPHSAD